MCYSVEVCSLLCVNDEEKSGVVLGYFLCISQLTSQKAKRPFFPPVYSMLSQSRLVGIPISNFPRKPLACLLKSDWSVNQ